MNFEYLNPVINSLLNDSPSAAARKIGRERLEEVRKLLRLPEIDWLSNLSLVDYVGKSPHFFALYKCWVAMERERDDDDPRAHLSDVKYFEYQIWFAVLDTEEIYLLCKVFGFGDGKYPNSRIPNRKKGAKAIAPILHEIKFGNEKAIRPKQSKSPEPARSQG